VDLAWHVEGEAETVPPGSVFFTMPWERHGSVHQREPGCELYYVVLRLDAAYARPQPEFRFHPSIPISPAQVVEVREALLTAPRRSWPATRRLVATLPDLIAEAERRDRLPEGLAALAALTLLELYRSVCGLGKQVTRPAAAQRVAQFVSRLAGECHRPWTLAEMARACDLGRTRFTTLLEQLTGDSPRMALNRARVARASDLLLTTDWPVTRVALDCGFASSQHFAGVFRAYTGQTATSARRRARRSGER
jgi:AraC-like DNA-binding protein